MAVNLTAVVLAGGSRDDVCREDASAPNKAFVRIAGSALVTRTLHALREARTISRIVVVSPVGAPRDPLGLADAIRPSGATVGASLTAGIAGLDPDVACLIVASDLALLTPNAVDGFTLDPVARTCDIGYGCLERSIHLAKYPDIAHTWARLRDGTYCGGGLAILRPRVLPQMLQLLERAGSARKAPWKLASLLGMRVLGKYLSRSLTIADIEHRAGALLDCDARAIQSTCAESAINVDRFEDIEAVLRLIAGTSRPGSAQRRRQR